MRACRHKATDVRLGASGLVPLHSDPPARARHWGSAMTLAWCIDPQRRGVWLRPTRNLHVCGFAPPHCSDTPKSTWSTDTRDLPRTLTVFFVSHFGFRGSLMMRTPTPLHVRPPPQPPLQLPHIDQRLVPFLTLSEPVSTPTAASDAAPRPASAPTARRGTLKSGSVHRITHLVLGSVKEQSYVTHMLS